jgi:hypothetical protein
MQKGGWRIHPGKVDIIIAPPIETAGMPPEREGELSDRVRNTLMKYLTST